MCVAQGICSTTSNVDGQFEVSQMPQKNVFQKCK